MAIQAVKNVAGNNACADCDAASKQFLVIIRQFLNFLLPFRSSLGNVELWSVDLYRVFWYTS
jgi:hypothetical protein